MKLKNGSTIAAFAMVVALVAACGATDAPATPVPVQPTPTSAPPTATPEPPSCEEVEGNCLELTFDGESCTYKGPTDLKAGPVTLFFHNESEGRAAVNLLAHTGDETIQDAIDYIGEEPTTKHHPGWTRELGTWRTVSPDESHTWEGVLEPGIYHMVCASFSEGGWFGTGLTVED